MKQHPSSNLTVGVEIQSSGMLYCLLNGFENTPEISVNVKPLYMSDDCVVSSILPSSEVLIKTLEAPLVKEKDLQSTLEFQIEPLIPFPPEEALFDKINIEKRTNSTLLAVFAVRKTALKSHLELFQDLIPESTIPLAIALSAYAAKVSKANTALIIHLAHNETTCLLVKNGHPVKALSCCSTFSEDERELLELNRTSTSLTKTDSPEEIIITGEGSQNKQLVSRLSNLFDKELSCYDHSTCAASYGAALHSQDSFSGERVNLRGKEFAFPHPWKHYRKPLKKYLLLSILFAVTTYLFGECYLSYRIDGVKQSYIGLLADVGKPFASFEEEVSFTGDNANPENLTLEDIELRVSKLTQQRHATPKLFPLQPNIPYVGDLLAWLTTNNIVSEGDGLTLESLHYSMVKRPDLNKKTEKYQVKVELAFTSPTPKQAREFHDFLVAPNPFVDPKSDIKWSSNRGQYKTSFFLKDRTNYRTR